jgi:hypothetical protein
VPDSPAVQRLRSLPVGGRVVVRFRVPGGFRDALGDLVRIDESSCTVLTRRGPVTVALADVALAKPVPPPPPRRAPRYPAPPVTP